MPTTYGNDIVYCLKSHCGVRGYCRQKWVLQVQIICKFSNERTCKRNKDVQGLSCGFEANQEINDKIIGVIAIGPIVKGPQGAECVRWNTKEKKWESKWTRSDVSSVSMIPAVSIKSEMVFVCGWNDASGWEVTGLDWKSGATRHRSILGKNNRANGAYAIIQYLANGDLLFNSVAGPIRVKY